MADDEKQSDSKNEDSSKESDEQQSSKDEGEKKDKDQQSEKSDEDKSALEKVTGIDTKELLKAPIDPPEIKDKRPPTSNQKFLFLVGIAILIIGVVSFPLNIYLSVIVGLIGLMVAAGSVLIRLE